MATIVWVLVINLCCFPNPNRIKNRFVFFSPKWTNLNLHNLFCSIVSASQKVTQKRFDRKGLTFKVCYLLGKGPHKRFEKFNLKIESRWISFFFFLSSSQYFVAARKHVHICTRDRLFWLHQLPELLQQQQVREKQLRKKYVSCLHAIHWGLKSPHAHVHTPWHPSISVACLSILVCVALTVYSECSHATHLMTALFTSQLPTSHWGAAKWMKLIGAEVIQSLPCMHVWFCLFTTICVFLCVDLYFGDFDTCMCYCVY